MNSRMMDDINAGKSNLENFTGLDVLSMIKDLMSFNYKVLFEDNTFKIYKPTVSNFLNNTRHDSISIQQEPFNSSNFLTNEISETYHIDCFSDVVPKFLRKERKKLQDKKEAEVKALKDEIEKTESILQNLKIKLEYKK